MAAAAISATDATRVQVTYNPDFKIEKEGGASITLLVIGILFVAGGVTVGVLGLKEILPLGDAGSKACIAGGSAVGVSFLVTGYFATAISNCRNGLSLAGVHNERILYETQNIYNRANRSLKPPTIDGLVYKEIATYQTTRENTAATDAHLKDLFEKCSKYSLYVDYSIEYLRTGVGHDGVSVTLKILTPVKV